ncbi:hypothetical protein NEOLEDRAFT_1135863 [Neolentinus lepideus HHB14362 ss-1]|uniref:Uncharacterized protein n=1 Tax=Neolentinus lepideus HHB14362 ss-1 TaxID=1314782 RepID=A0A165RG26_9AGAM|nr:hypothetical protein NEOLEDRAFT_1135863 [Neolentinus lepideus HHB14362 ss-1]
MELPYPVVIAQYKRDDYGVGKEEHFHWALVIIYDKQTLAGYAIQAVDRTVRGEEPTWQIDCRVISSLSRSSKCLGGVQVASIKHTAVQGFLQAVHEHGIGSSARPGWRCKDYVLELLEVLRTYGTLQIQHLSVEAILSALRDASGKTHAQSIVAQRCVPHMRWL